MLSEQIIGGFSSPVFDAQSTFRALMDAFARPGSIHAIKAGTQPPPPLSAGAAAVALTLCDKDTPLWLDAALQGAVVSGWLGFHSGAAVAATPADAHFALVADTANLIALDNFAQGTQEYPDRSTTLVLQVASLTSGEPLVLEGPGTNGMASLAPTPLPRHFIEQWKQNNARFPRGVDLVLVAPEGVACLPRTTRIGIVRA